MVIVLDRIYEWHQDMSMEEIISAWNARLKTQMRLNQYQAYMTSFGVSSTGKFIKMLAFNDGEDTVIFHVMTPTGQELFSRAGSFKED